MDLGTTLLLGRLLENLLLARWKSRRRPLSLPLSSALRQIPFAFHPRPLMCQPGIICFSDVSRSLSSRCHDPCVCAKSFRRVGLFPTPGTVAHQSLGFSRQEHWSGLPCPPPGELPDSGIKPASHYISRIAGRFFTTSTTWEACHDPCLGP